MYPKGKDCLSKVPFFVERYHYDKQVRFSFLGGLFCLLFFPRFLLSKKFMLLMLNKRLQKFGCDCTSGFYFAEKTRKNVLEGPDSQLTNLPLHKELNLFDFQCKH